MKTEQPAEPLKSTTAINKKLSKPIRILLVIFVGVVFLALLLKVGDFVYCRTVAICDYVRPTMSPERIATIMPLQYEYAIKDINAGRYEAAKQRFEYIIYRNPEYPGAKEKLLEVEKMLKITPTP